ncbi:hypothetical protein [Corynebacterium diphtheriae]|uniref:hypothetical protein n=1 Tax=Corynebacterium diphtheriae TaxID=1717 RepID=UPI000D083380|nr:hypothetical protein [Corynebacterium diphtheriae]PSA82005.1 hypothetical protein BT096_08065 [Corynebacterium diphtheriae]UWE77788.1 hypothetical protein NY032_01820 [Corynebacterium diphtheriae bv. gravis]UWF03168.1 hypothetical protein NY047_01860 [Corynebacterium diphtheriae bv. gravis]UWF15559.1 hypothetical protein NY030_11235 [Corynebacterium diphtheriae bv. gravis]UWF18392.1 hypothetical protein NY029_03650 [Corynebacterium diphtheriae bv. gravis]
MPTTIWYTCVRSRYTARERRLTRPLDTHRTRTPRSVAVADTSIRYGCLVIVILLEQEALGFIAPAVTAVHVLVCVHGIDNLLQPDMSLPVNDVAGVAEERAHGCYLVCAGHVAPGGHKRYRVTGDRGHDLPGGGARQLLRFLQRELTRGVVSQLGERAQGWS